MRHPSGRDSATPSVRAVRRSATPRVARCTVLLLLMLVAGAVFVAPALAAGSVSGLICDEGLRPLSGIQVHMLRSIDGGATYGPSGMGVSDGSGAYSVPTPGAGLYKVWFDDPLGDYVSEWWDNRSGGPENADPIALGEDGTFTWANAVLVRGGHAGGVVNAVGGAPLANIRVDVHRWIGGPQGWDGYAMGMSAADGTWSVGGLAPGEYRFHFRDEMGGVYADQFFDHQSTADRAHSVHISGGMTANWVNADLQVGGLITGVVRDEGGEPVAGITVTACAYDPVTGGWPGVREFSTDPLGKYSLGPLAPGQYRLWFHGDDTWVSEWWQDKVNDWEADFVAVNAGDTVVCGTVLTRAGVIGGHVVADEGGTPVDGVQVFVEYWVGWEFGGWQDRGPLATTDGNGDYLIAGLQPGTYRVGFRDPDGDWAEEWHDDTIHDRAADVQVNGGETTTVDASLAVGGHIAGTVRDTEGNPIPGIEISACRFMGEEAEEQWLWGWWTQTDASGFFSLDGLAVGTYQIELSDPNGVYAVEVYEDALNSGRGIDLEVVAGGTTAANPILERGGRIYGQVVDPGGEGIANVTVIFNGWVDDPEPEPDPDPGTDDGHWEWYTECWTDENGDFSMSGLQPRETVVQFQDDQGRFVGELYNNVQDWGAATPVVVRSGKSRNMGTVELAPVAHIAGTVTAAGGGGGLENIEVTVARWNGEWGEWEQFAGTQTGPGGGYDVGGLTSGSYRVRFWDGSGAYAGEWFENASDAWSGQDVVVTEGGTTQVDAALEQACVIEGHVTDGSANPLGGIEAILYYREAGSGEWTQYQLDNEQRMFTDGDGYYRFAGLPARTYQLRLENNDNPSPWAAEVFDGALVVGTGTDLTLAPGETRVADPELDLGGRLAGRLLEDQPPFTPLSFAFPMEIGVWAWVPDASPEGGSWQWYAGYATGEGTDGYMHGSPLAPGAYRIDINSWVGAYVPEWYDDARDLEHSTPVTITAGEVTDLGVIYMTKSAMIYGTVTGPDGQPVAGVTVRKWTLVDGQWEPGYSFESWSDGFYLLGEMAGGTYRVEFDGRALGFSREFWDGASSVLGASSIVLAPREEVHGIDAQLEVPGAIAGHVRDAGGDPITGVDVMLAVWDDIAGRYVDLDDMQSAARVDDQGAWRLDGLRPGTYKVFSSPGAPDHGDGVVEGVVVRAGETTEVDIVPPLAGSIAGRVTVIGGAPVQDARVRLFIWDPYELEWQGLAMPAQTQADGTYSLPLVTPGTYRLAFEPSNGSGLAQEFWDNRDMVTVCQDVTLTEDQDLTGVDAVLGPEADVAPPSAPIVTGADGNWHAAPVGLTFSSTDDLSGVEEYEYRVDGGPWQHGDHATIAAPAGHGNDGVHDVAARAVDFVGHVGDTTHVQVRIDTTGPVVSDDDPGLWLRGPVTVNLSALDAGCGVVDHLEYAPTEDGPWTVGTSFYLRTWKRSGGSGERTTWVRGIDGLGNASSPQAVIVRLDGVAPVTTHDSDGLVHEEDVTLHLTLNDAHSGAGITFFSVDGGMWMIGDTLSVPAHPGGWNDGVHGIRFYSVDAVGNVEATIKSCTVTIDTSGAP